MIILEAYQKSWPKLYSTEKTKILDAVGNWIEGIEHIGSTSIPNLPAKPTIDICLGVKSLEIADLHIIKPLQQLGYDYLPHLEADIPERRYFQKLDVSGAHLVHIHVVVMNAALWNNHLRFRNYLIAHPQEAKLYAALKHNLKAQFQHDRKAYTEGKADFIRNILKKALIWEQSNA